MSRCCARCGADFSCGMDAGTGSACWCMALPHLAALPPAPATAADAAALSGCWCRACLEQHIAQRTAAASGSPPA